MKQSAVLLVHCFQFSIIQLLQYSTLGFSDEINSAIQVINRPCVAGVILKTLSKFINNLTHSMGLGQLKILVVFSTKAGPPPPLARL